jgi:hypothetical protein
MITKVKFKSIEELLEAQDLATKLNVDVGIHSDDGTIIDIKTFLELSARSLCMDPSILYQKVKNITNNWAKL